MTWQAGRSGNPGGRPKEKPFRDALRIEAIAAENGEPCVALKGSLRWNARQLLERGDPVAIREIADRLDGKPAQEASLTIETRRAVDLTDDELAFIAAGGRERTAEEANGSPVLN